MASSVRSSEISKLDTSHSLGMAGSLSVMLTKHFQSLTSLVVSDCGLVSDDLSSLAKAGSQGRLPQLGHLDLSDNVGIRGHFQRLFLHGHQWGHLLSLNVKQAAGVTPGDEFHEIVKFTRLGALVHLEHLICTATNIDVHLSSSSDLKWPSVQHLHVHCAHIYGSSDNVQLYQQLTDLVEKGVFPNLNTLSVTSQIIPKHAISRASDNVSISELQEASIEAMYLQDIRDVSSFQIAVHLPNDELHLKYLFELMNVNSALENTFEQKMNRSVSKMFRTFSYHGGDIVGGPLGREIIRSGLYECLDSYHVDGRERSCLVSLGNAVIDIMLVFVTGETVDVHPLCNALQDCTDTFLDISKSEIDRSLVKSLVEIGCKNVELGLKGQPLELQPMCPVLQDMIAVSFDITNPFRPLLKSVVDAVESVLVGNRSDFQSASSEIREWTDNAPDCSASERYLVKFIAEVFCIFLNCFFTKPLDLQPVRSLLFDFVDKPSDQFMDLCKSPAAQFITKFGIDSICMLVESFCNNKSKTDAMSNKIRKWFEKMPDLLESNQTIRKEFAYIIHII